VSAPNDHADATTVAEPGQRDRILDAALTLVSELGSAGTSMRRLASACGLNVATIYHYFPSKADLLRALVEEQRYGERMAADGPAIDPDLPPADRFAAFFAWVASETLAEETVLRLLLGEGLRHNAVAADSARDLVAALDVTLESWLAAGFPEMAEGPAGCPPSVAARLVRRSLLALVTEHLATGGADPATTGSDLGQILF
jgi:AcrR family transcriptional regulator